MNPCSALLPHLVPSRLVNSPTPGLLHSEKAKQHISSTPQKAAGVRRFTMPFLTSLTLLNYSLHPVICHQNPLRNLEGLFSKSDIARHGFINREGHGWGLCNVTHKWNCHWRTYHTFALNIHLAIANPAHGCTYHIKTPFPYVVSMFMVISPKLLRSHLSSCQSEINQGWEGK